MELNREHFRAIIFYNFRCGLTQQQCIDELYSIFGDEALSRTSVYRWYGEFNWGCILLQDEFREGRPKSVVVPETIDAVHQLIFQDHHVTYREIETTLAISGTSIHSILHEHDCQKKLFALDSTQFVNRSKKSINQSDKRDSIIGSNACKSVSILMGNILKNNKAIFDD